MALAFHWGKSTFVSLSRPRPGILQQTIAEAYAEKTPIAIKKHR
jgi:hypothetical protein